MSKEVLVQHNAMSTARYEMTASEKNIIYMLLFQLKKDDTVDTVYKISVREMEKVTGRYLEYKQVKESTERLTSCVYTIVEDSSLVQIRIISSAVYIEGSGRIAIRINPEVRPYLFDLKKNFTKFGFYVAMILKSRYSKRIYEMLCQFKSTGIVRISLEDLKARLGLAATKSRREKYTGWPMFKKNVIETAKRELEEHGDIYFTYKAEKVGRSVTDLEFRINQKELSL